MSRQTGPPIPVSVKVDRVEQKKGYKIRYIKQVYKQTPHAGDVNEIARDRLESRVTTEGEVFHSGYDNIDWNKKAPRTGAPVIEQPVNISKMA